VQGMVTNFKQGELG
jgi:hypothetical protein